MAAVCNCMGQAVLLPCLYSWVCASGGLGACLYSSLAGPDNCKSDPGGPYSTWKSSIYCNPDCMKGTKILGLVEPPGAHNRTYLEWKTEDDDSLSRYGGHQPIREVPTADVKVVPHLAIGVRHVGLGVHQPRPFKPDPQQLRMGKNRVKTMIFAENILKLKPSETRKRGSVSGTGVYCKLVMYD